MDLSYKVIKKAPTGIRGLDEILAGGLPSGRPTLVYGAAGCGKTLMSMQFLVNGAIKYNEPGVFISFEENEHELAENVASLGLDLPQLAAENKLLIDYVQISPEEIVEAGEFTLDGLFIRIESALQSIGAKRIVLDTIGNLFSGIKNTAIVRAELNRLFRWIKDKKLTAIVTSESNDRHHAGYGVEEFVSDCVIYLDHRVDQQVYTRRIRVVKYRGSVHGTNEFPFLIDDKGIFILPITSSELVYPISEGFVSTGIAKLDGMLAGKGLYKASTALLSGTAGTGKSSIAAHFVDAAAMRGEKALFFAFEEAPAQIVRNMRSIGIDLQQWVDKGLLRFSASRPSMFGLEQHLVKILQKIIEFEPDVVVIDPINSFVMVENSIEVKMMLIRLVDFLKMRGITAMFTSLTSGRELEQTDVNISSLIDTWILVRDLEYVGERNRGIYILKSRGMAHSNQVREFLLTDHGVDLVDVYIGPSGVLTGSARLAQEVADRANQQLRQQEIERLKRELDRRRQEMDLKISEIRMTFEAEEAELEQLMIQEKIHEDQILKNRLEIGKSRQAESKEE